MASEVFEGQVALLVRVLPYVATEACFALKGGTAINLFFETCLVFRWTSIWFICRLRIGIDDALYEAFLAYILSHNRPTHELLQPRFKEIRRTFETEFVGMTIRETSLDALLSTREQLVAEIRSRLDETSKLFLRFFHTLSPDWNLISTHAIRNLPAVRWKLKNLERLQSENPEKYQTILQQLDAALS